MKHFLFYDIETSGLNPAFDQVLTFACIQTNLDLTELSRQVITVKLRPDIVPAPGAFLTHGLTLEELDAGICEYEAALKIHKLFNTPGTISIGYNSLGFDDEFLRFLFYRNLLDPYSHQYANGCSRMDMLPVAVIYRLFADHVLSWPILENKGPSLKLEHLSCENKFEVTGKAHEAMADVEALLSLSRIFSRERDIWTYVQGFFDKQVDLKRIQGLKPANLGQNTDFKLGLMVSVSFGANLNYIAPVIHVGQSIPYKNQSLWVRLDNPDLLTGGDEENGIYDFFAIRKRPGDALFVLPWLDRFSARLTVEALAACQKNLNILCCHDARFLKTAAHHRAFKYPNIPDIDIDASLYQDGFFSRDERGEIAAFHQADPGNRIGISDTFVSSRVRTLAQRILVRSFGQDFKGNHEFYAHLQNLVGDASHPRVKGHKNDLKFTCAQAILELEKLECTDDMDRQNKEMILWLKSYIDKLSAFLAEPL